jgi:hypothetical protein
MNTSVSQVHKTFGGVDTTAAIQSVLLKKQQEINLLKGMTCNNTSGNQLQSLSQIMIRGNQINQLAPMTENECQNLFSMKNKSEGLEWQSVNQNMGNGSMELNQNKLHNSNSNSSKSSGDSSLTFLGNKVQQGSNSTSQQLEAILAKKLQVIQSMTSQPQSNLKPVNSSIHAYGNALEKLCETMKRSAMSRTMIKQLSAGRIMTKQGGGRGVTKQNPGRDLAALALQASGRADELFPPSVVISSSSVSSGRLTPPRVPNRRSATESKHRMNRESASVRSASPSRRIGRDNSGRSLSSGNVWNELTNDISELGNPTNDIDKDFFADMIFSD